ncbi:PP0621 family protein [Nitratifractor sp.]|uniref:PP0621 family protein n=1 Tax=Nitratifractor sp. TaxID=2268144 RepID=UPI0025E66AA3|nr:PP0621 family protein [Nitratifractor sp.]
MLLKLILIGAVLYGLYRLTGGRLLPEGGFKRAGKNGKKSEAESDDDTLVECEKCSTYVVKKEAIFYKGKYYCSRECLPK